MADRVHPIDSLPIDGKLTETSEKAEIPDKSNPPVPEKPVTQPGTYVVQIPKDQVLRVPPPENARRFQSYCRRKSRRNCCRSCFCWILGLIALLILLIAITAGVFYLVVRPESPNYTVDNISIKGLNLTSSNLNISPEFNVTVKAENPNKKMGIYYEKGSSVTVSYYDLQLCNGVLPALYQPKKNVTVFKTALTGSGIRLTGVVHNALVAEQKKGNIPLKLNLKVPVKIKVGSVKTWTITVKADCDISVDKLTVDAKIVSKTCDVTVKPWN